MKNNYVVIMAGGAGTRFWPMSRAEKPKQFLDILGTGKTLLQQTYERFLPEFDKENIFVVTNEAYGDLVREQLPDLTDPQILLEPSRKNTAPCIAYAAYKLHQTNPDAVMVVASSDHLILNENSFKQVIMKAVKAAANKDSLITIGLKPSRPDTGYGYIQFNEEESYPSEAELFKVKTFTEKPEYEMAKFFLQSGDFLWNSGIFVWSTQSIVEAFEKYQPDLAGLFGEEKEKYNTPAEKSLIEKAFTVCKNISVDYAIMEKADNVFVLGADFGWSDLGTWGSLYEHSNKSNEGNAVSGKNVILYDTTNCVVKVPKDKLVVLEGLDDYIVVENDNILLVCRKSQEQQIRQIVNDVKINKGEKFV
jgi:mannose-1-phosphate guanylyltransferase